MKFVILPGPVALIGRPEFKQGYLYGLALPACVIRLQLTAGVESILEKKSRDILHAQLGEPEIGADDEGCAFTRTANKIAYWCLEVQNRCGLFVQRDFRVGSVTPPADGAASVSLTLPYRFAEPAMAALSLVINLINRSAGNKPAVSEIRTLVDASTKLIARYRERGQNVPDILKAAGARGIPFQRVDGQLYQFGIGGAQRMLESTFTDKTALIGANLCRDKMMAANILSQSGYPGGTPVQIDSADAAFSEAVRLGYPVVVKPIDADGGRGVWADIRSEADVRKAFDVARAESSRVMIDRHVAGTGHRFTIMFGKVVKVTAKMPWGVTGDGTSTIAALVGSQHARANEDNAAPPVKGKAPTIDDEALSLLRQYALTLDSVPAAGEFIALRRRNNANAGGSTVLLELDKVHDDNLALALRLATLFMLDVAGIDLIIPDISRSWLEQDCLICDVNSQPQVGTTAAADFLAEVIPGSGRIGVTLVLVPAGMTAMVGAVRAELSRRWKIDGFSASAGVWIHGAQVGRSGLNGYKAAKALFAHRDVFNAAVVMSAEEIDAFGLPADRFQRLVIVGAATPASQSRATLRVCLAGESSRESLEQGISQAALVPARSDASALVEKIWLHFDPTV